MFLCLDQWVNNRMFQSILVTALFMLKRKLFKCFNITRDSFRRVMAQVFPELCHHHHYFHEVDQAPQRGSRSPTAIGYLLWGWGGQEWVQSGDKGDRALEGNQFPVSLPRYFTEYFF